MSNERTFIRGGSTFERITLKDTVIGAIIYWGGMIGLRVGLLAYAVIWALVTGRYAGYLVLGAAVLALQDIHVTTLVPPVYAWRFNSQKYKEQRKTVNLAIVAGCALCIAQLSGVWPRIWWDMMPGAGCSGPMTLFIGDTGHCVSALATWLRFLFIGASAWVLWTPSALLNWVFQIEQTHPKARETTFAQADPASVTGPDGQPYAKQARRGTRLIDAEEVEDYEADYGAIGAIHEAGE